MISGKNNDVGYPIEMNNASGKMLSRTASELYVRDFAPFISDEPPKRDGEDRGPSPLEYVMAALCA